MTVKYLMKRFVIAAAIGMLAAVMLLTGCKGDENTAGNSQDKAKGSITLYTSQPEQDAQKLIEAFNKKYPDIKVNVFRSGTEEVVSKLLAEKQAGKIQADVLLAADAATFESLKQQDMLLSYASPELKGIKTEFYDKDNTYTGTKIISTGIIYNTKMVQEKPASFMDLTKPEYKDSIIMPSPMYSGAAAYNIGVLTRTNGLGWEYFKALKDNGVRVDKGNGNILKAVVDGQMKAGMVVDYMALRSKAKGAAVDFVYPTEGSLIITEPVGILKATQNAALAKKFVDFILSEEGQKTTAEIGYTPIKSGVKAPEGFKTVDELKNLTFDISTLVNERNADKEKFSTIFQ